MEADPPAAHRLPQEIFDVVVGHYSEDTDVLSTLALVSRSWLHSARTHLFAKVELEAGVDDLDPLERVNVGLELLKSSPAIASCIRYVTLNGLYADIADITVQGFEFLSHLPNIRSLTFLCISWPDLRPAKVPIQKALSVMASTLESLTFEGIDYASVVELSAFIRACSNTKSLEFAGIRWEEDLHAPVFFRDLSVLWGKRPVRLKQISLRDMTPSTSLRPVLEMLLERDAFELDLEKLVLDWDGTWNSSSFHKSFSRAIGSSLKTITLHVGVPRNQDPGDIIQLLSRCNQLSSFILIILTTIVPHSIHWFEPILDTLAEASSSHLKKITIECGFYTDLEKNQFLPWAKLESAISNTRRFPVFEKLRVVVTQVSRSPADRWRSHAADIEKDVCRNLEESMPRAAKAGL
ncbi:hypothetical protein BDZ89DRAFT_1067530 [Hymenopellis radicata]|nr:hypothetical protein BDZ89DRAFT_1067530 [Hymenopellis radicata]